ncbi:hypothetical protein [Paenibacillus sp. P22]|uniref:hypothetical protein n=1 Tax=Paenibacillus sp. P22 TaxID=483908 RepID=UPI000433BB8A|nr:hypothetical protein [Paenibacillus sp. P22]CDN45396.1 hypothetical protein BN871_HI_00170 [Paenibacillus sp. P22]
MKTYAYVAVTKTADGRVAAGVEFQRLTDEGFLPYWISSWVRDGLKSPSIRQAVTLILSESLAAVDPEHTEVEFASFVGPFHRHAEIRDQLRLCARDGLKIRLRFEQRHVIVRRSNALELANDALRRGTTISMPV